MSNELVIAVLLDGKQVAAGAATASANVDKMVGDIKESLAGMVESWGAAAESISVADDKISLSSSTSADVVIAKNAKLVASQRALIAALNERLASGTLGADETTAATMALNSAHQKLGDSIASTGTKLDSLATKAQVAGRAMSMYLTAPIVVAAAVSAKM